MDQAYMFWCSDCKLQNWDISVNNIGAGCSGYGVNVLTLTTRCLWFQPSKLDHHHSPCLEIMLFMDKFYGNIKRDTVKCHALPFV
jgi:hypothetical protein